MKNVFIISIAVMAAVALSLPAGCTKKNENTGQSSGTSQVGQAASPQVASSPAVAKDMRKYRCTKCGYIYDPAGNSNIPFPELSDSWVCKKCGAPKTKFKPVD